MLFGRIDSKYKNVSREYGEFGRGSVKISLGTTQVFFLCCFPEIIKLPEEFRF